VSPVVEGPTLLSSNGKAQSCLVVQGLWLAEEALVVFGSKSSRLFWEAPSASLQTLPGRLPSPVLRRFAATALDGSRWSDRW
jgi:hypothetical protein